MGLVEGHGLPLGVSLHSASPSETRLVSHAFEDVPSKRKPQFVIGDGAFDSAPLAKELEHDWGVRLVAPPRCTRKTFWCDGRHLRRYRRRWKVERFFAWLGGFRRLLVRWEHKANNYLGFLHLACALILMRHY